LQRQGGAVTQHELGATTCSLAYLLRNFTQRDSSGAVQIADYLRALCANINPYRESVTINGGLEPSIHELGSRDRKEGHFGFAGDSLGEKRLAGARGPTSSTPAARKQPVRL
jgi:hypothetical protein